MEKISEAIVGFISRNMPIDDEEMLDVYKYGIEITLSSLINFLIIIILSLLPGDLTAGFIFMFCFIFLRSYTGGYHAEEYWRCNVAFAVTYTLTYFAGRFSEKINLDILAVIILLLLGIVPVIIFAPVKNRHKILSESKRKKSRIISLILYILFSVLSVVLCKINIGYGYLISATLLSVSLLILIEVFMQKKGYHTEVRDKE